ncbi:hypothetical protein C9927_00755 [Pseudidiomarina aestuarii]|uniref:Type 4 fimbrial biogenesis protein PilX N-terminal domain-containing protein n=1 Tax=Pseudidiomarina aestuarii TaxID=624146 RepID=A0A2T4CNH4_9GAMM|nr:hypothetical protein C9986_01050 [Pseudidiomarina aestuarii]PTB90115.1 hypothetical protein C9927_00755 [Pseudidiomarina aestuarii]
MASKHPHQGFATLTLSVLLLSIIILATLYTARFKAQEQRVMRNHAAMQEAHTVADAALEQVIMLVDASPGDLNRTINGVIGAASYTANLSGTRLNNTVRGIVDVVDVTVAAQSADGRGTQTFRQQLAVIPLLRTAPDVPLAIKGSINVSGSFEVVANPNGGGDGVPLSIWTSEDVDINGAGTTCGQEEWTTGNCRSNPFSERGDHGVDILDNDPNFPDDLMMYLFGVEEENWADVRAMANAVYPNCDSLSAASSGLIWIDGSCALSSGQVGTADDPAILVVKDGDIRINGSMEIFGFVFSFRTPGNIANYDLRMNGGAFVQGAVMANFDPNTANGNFTVRYNQEVLETLVESDSFRRVYRVGGSWHDF